MVDVNQDGYVDYFDSSLITAKSVNKVQPFPFDNKNAYKVTYDLDGGTESKRNQRYYIDDIELYNPTRTGYTFNG